MHDADFKRAKDRHAFLAALFHALKDSRHFEAAEAAFETAGRVFDECIREPERRTNAAPLPAPPA